MGMFMRAGLRKTLTLTVTSNAYYPQFSNVNKDHIGDGQFASQRERGDPSRTVDLIFEKVMITVSLEGKISPQKVKTPRPPCNLKL